MSGTTGQETLQLPGKTLDGTEHVEVATSPGSSKFKTTTQAIGNLGTAAHGATGATGVTGPTGATGVGTAGATGATGSGGGGALAGGLGISLDTITNPGTTAINNTGTISQPSTSGTVNALGVTLKGGDVAVSTGGHGGEFYAKAGDAGGAFGAYLQLFGSQNTKGGKGFLSAGGGSGTGFAGGNMYVYAGAGYPGGTLYLFGGSGGLADDAVGGNVVITGAYSAASGGNVSLIGCNSGTAGTAGNLVFTTGTGGTNGVFLMTHNPGTSSATSGVVYADAITGILHRKP